MNFTRKECSRIAYCDHFLKQRWSPSAIFTRLLKCVKLDPYNDYRRSKHAYRERKTHVTFLRPIHSHQVHVAPGCGSRRRKTHVTFHTSNAFTPGACGSPVWIQKRKTHVTFHTPNAFKPRVHVDPGCGSRKRKTHVTFHTPNAFTPDACGSPVWIQETENSRYFSYVQCIHTSTHVDSGCGSRKRKTHVTFHTSFHTRCMWIPGMDLGKGKLTLLFIRPFTPGACGSRKRKTHAHSFS